MRGISDTPTEKDAFEISPYIEALSEFIAECDTPMTIAIQGDWGCGKTSMMNMVKAKLGEEVLSIWFNTWQFSQFNMDEQLSVILLRHLVNKLSEVAEDNASNKCYKERATKVFKTIAAVALSAGIGEGVGDAVLGAFAKEESDIVSQVEQLKDLFSEIVKTVAEKRKRTVIFIDDLDRLQPIRAIEILEVLKNYFDCNNCVFILAVDTSVVFQGIKEKYGSDISNEKAQSFFDKMIQLPFKMPTAYYTLDPLIKKLIDFLDKEKEQDVGMYVDTIRLVTEGNPRSIKRLVNSFLLTDKVAQRKGIYKTQVTESYGRKLLLYLSCIQLKYEDVYDFIVASVFEDIKFTKAVYDGNDSDKAKEIVAHAKRLSTDEIVQEETLIKLTEKFVGCITTVVRELAHSEGGTLADALTVVRSILCLVDNDSLNIRSEVLDRNKNTAEKESLTVKNKRVQDSKNDLQDAEDENLTDKSPIERYKSITARGVYPIFGNNFVNVSWCYLSEQANDFYRMFRAPSDGGELNLYNNLRSNLELLFMKYDKHYPVHTLEIEKVEYWVKTKNCYKETDGRYVDVKYKKDCFSVGDGSYAPAVSLLYHPNYRFVSISLANEYVNCIDTLGTIVELIKELKDEYKELQRRFGKDIFRDDYFGSASMKFTPRFYNDEVKADYVKPTVNETGKRSQSSVFDQLTGNIGFKVENESKDLFKYFIKAVEEESLINCKKVVLGIYNNKMVQIIQKHLTSISNINIFDICEHFN